MEADKDRDGKISFEEFTKMVENTDISMSMTLGAALAPSVSAVGFSLRAMRHCTDNVPCPQINFKGSICANNTRLVACLKRLGNDPHEVNTYQVIELRNGV